MKQEKITRFVKPEDANRKWYIVDAKDQVLGRLASEIAKVIRGKNKTNENINNTKTKIQIHRRKTGRHV